MPDKPSPTLVPDHDSLPSLELDPPSLEDAPPDKTLATVDLPPSGPRAPMSGTDGTLQTWDGGGALLAADSPAPRAHGPHRLGDRYMLLEPLGAGGMGEVHRAWDLKLKRTVAVKFIHASHVGQLRAEQRFEREIFTLAQLDHPGIVALHDSGALEDGRAWFTMREVRGRTLGHALDAFHERVRGGEAEGTLRPRLMELIELLRRAADAVAFAHEKGVVHRDLKPDNIMIGPFAEVQVMDWGLVRFVRAAEAPTGEDAPPLLPGMTHAGATMGTPGYMAPEQARGAVDAIGLHTDVFAIGAMLYHLLAGRAPYVGTAAEVVEATQSGPPTPLSKSLLPGLPDPGRALLRVCSQAMARTPAARFPSAKELSNDLGRYLTGVQRHEDAAAAVRTARAHQEDAERALELAEQLDAEARRLQGDLPELASPKQKQGMWVMQDAAKTARRDAAQAEAAVERDLHAALRLVEGFPEALYLLGDTYKRRLLEAEERGDLDQEARSEVLLKGTGEGTHDTWLRGQGRITLLTHPTGASVSACPIKEIGRRRTPGAPIHLGKTPLLDAPIDRGEHLLLIEAPGHAPLRLPVRVGRQQDLRFIAPGEEDDRVLQLSPEASLGPDEVRVAEGSYRYGGDPLASDGFPGGVTWAPDLVVARHPVSNAEFVCFLNALLDDGDAERAEQLQPRRPSSGDGGPDSGAPLYERTASGRFIVGGRIQGQPAQPDWPVALVSWHAAMAYAAWWRRETGQAWRLPHELEWEKFVRGGLGWPWPWGAHFEPAWANLLGSQGELLAPAAIGEFPEDESLWGVQGVAGNVREWCWNGYAVVPGLRVPSAEETGEARYRVCRGGFWGCTPNLGRPATRWAALPHQRFFGVGFRLVRELKSAVR